MTEPYYAEFSDGSKVVEIEWPEFIHEINRKIANGLTLCRTGVVCRFDCDHLYPLEPGCEQELSRFRDESSFAA